VEARGRGPEGETLEGQKAMRGTTCGHRVTPPAANGPSECIQSLKLVWVSGRDSSSPIFGRRTNTRRCLRTTRKGKRGKRRREALRLSGGGNL
jgi:hypothetical protein